MVCPHLHPLQPDSLSTGSVQHPATFYTSVADDRREVTTHRLDTRSSETALDECWSPPSGEEHSRTTSVCRFSSSPPPLPEPLLDTKDRLARTRGCEDLQARVLDGDGYSVQQESSREGLTVSLCPTRPLHRPLTRQWQRPSHSVHSNNNIMTKNSLPLAQSSSNQGDGRAPTLKESDATGPEGLFLIAPDQDAPLLLGKTKPVPPPKTTSSTVEPPHETSTSPSSDRQSYFLHQEQCTKKSSPKHRHHSKTLQSTVSSPALFQDGSSPPHHRRVVSFRHCKAGEEQGQFRADYLGSKEVDSYISVVNSVAKQLVDQRPAEVVAFVSSQKIRLAPPRNEAVLFKSFAVKDILMVEKCSINKRIIGIIVWKSKTRAPTCHVLRCPDEIVSKALYEAVWEQTQIYDDVPLNEVSQNPLCNIIIEVCIPHPCCKGYDDGTLTLVPGVVPLSGVCTTR